MDKEIFLKCWETVVNRAEMPEDCPEHISRQINAFSDQKILETLNMNEKIRNEVATEFFSSLSSLDSKALTQHPFIEEEIQYLEYKKAPISKILSTKFVQTASKYYDETQFNAKFYIQQIEKTKANKDPLSKEGLAEEMLEKWKGLLERKKEIWFFEELEKWRKEFLEKLYEQIEQFQKMLEILGPFTEELGRLWDLSKGLWRTVGFDILKYYSEMIEKEPEFVELARYLGRMQAAREEMILEKIKSTSMKPEFKVVPYFKEEIVSVHESNDINNLLPMELGLLDKQTLQTLFFYKFAERKLLTYDFIGYESFQSEFEVEEEQETEKEDEKGPIIICVDTSGSMHGIPERIAKTLCFAILRVALLQNRKCYLISFSTDIKTIELTDFEKNLSALIEFLSHSFHGGTDATPALEESLRMLETEDYKKADVLMISDFIMGNLPTTTVSKIRKFQENDTRFHSLVIGRSENHRVVEVFDNNWIYNTGSSNPFKQILQKLETLRQKETPSDNDRS
ncbi:MAG: VWA domain-containing protein [Methanobacteriota archaeon]|nr:MAG: VWA domain-containing protein [Euryarchaeota archaeon]